MSGTMEAALEVMDAYSDLMVHGYADEGVLQPAHATKIMRAWMIDLVTHGCDAKQTSMLLVWKQLFEDGFHIRQALGLAIALGAREWVAKSSQILCIGDGETSISLASGGSMFYHQNAIMSPLCAGDALLIVLAFIVREVHVHRTGEPLWNYIHFVNILKHKLRGDPLQLEKLSEALHLQWLYCSVAMKADNADTMHIANIYVSAHVIEIFNDDELLRTAPAGVRVPLLHALHAFKQSMPESMNVLAEAMFKRLDYIVQRVQSSHS